MEYCERCEDLEAGDFEYIRNPATGQIQCLCAHCADRLKETLGEREDTNETQ